MDEKRFHKSDSLVYQYTTVKYPPKANPQENEFTRKFCLVHAANGVTWGQIAEEIHHLRQNITLDMKPVLLTVMVDYPDFIVALTLNGAMKLIDSMLERNSTKIREYAYFDQVNDFAKEMVATRDLKNFENSPEAGFEKYRKTMSDFWPK